LGDRREPTNQIFPKILRWGPHTKSRALEVVIFKEMRYINLCFTYLLIYLLTYLLGVKTPKLAAAAAAAV